MSNTTRDWTRRLKNGLNSLAEKIARLDERARGEFDRQGEGSHLGPLAYHARVRQAYARLELPYGAKTEEVRSSYRRLMRRYHPDRHCDAKEKEQLATEISQKLTAAYHLLLDHLTR